MSIATSPREKAMQDAVQRELDALPPLRPGATSRETLAYIAEVYAGGNRILNTPLPPETWRERFIRWFR